MASEAPSWADNGMRVVLVQWRTIALDPKKTSARTRIRVLRAVLPDSKATAMIGVHKIKSGASICVTWTKKNKNQEKQHFQIVGIWEDPNLRVILRMALLQ